MARDVYDESWISYVRHKEWRCLVDGCKAKRPLRDDSFFCKKCNLRLTKSQSDKTLCVVPGCNNKRSVEPRERKLSVCPSCFKKLVRARKKGNPYIKHYKKSYRDS